MSFRPPYGSVGTFGTAGLLMTALGFAASWRGAFEPSGATASEPPPATADDVELRWFGATDGGAVQAVTCGVPWPRGTLPADAPLAVCVGDTTLPTHAWPLAFWPDGSVKWTGVATVVPGPGDREPLTLRRVASPAPGSPLRCTVAEDVITVENGSFRSVVGRQGDRVIVSIHAGDRELCSGGRLKATLRRRAQSPDGRDEQVVDFLGSIDRASVESAGPVRVVVKIDGHHVQPATGERIFPFRVRLSFHAGDPAIGMTHSFVYDGDPNLDFLQGVGVTFAVPLRDAPHNRRVWFGADRGGVWTEHVRSLPPMLPGSGSANPDRELQLAGQRIDPGQPPSPQRAAVKTGAEAMPTWQEFHLVQDGAERFTITKSCGPEFTDLTAGRGHRAPGVAVVSDTEGGLAIGQQDFWKTHPAELEIADAAASAASMTAWFWSPRARASDMRHYTDNAYGAVYENAYPFQWQACPNSPECVSAHGTGKSSRLRIWPLDEPPDREVVAAVAAETCDPPTLVCTPEHYHRTGAFGSWSVVSRDSPQRAALEDRLAALLDFYLAEVEHRSWYGFWDYGDIRHSYDPLRHVWRYDEGGYGWTNAEGMPDLWLWYSFLRTGREDVFRFATAMGRHNADVDVFHIGYAAGKGSRHNVSHWGCNVKTERVSQAAGRRFLYYLTADEQIGDRLAEVVEHHPSGVVETQVSPGWSSYCSNWLTAAERSGKARDRDKLIAGIEGLLAGRDPFVDQRTVLLDMATGKISPGTGTYGYHMTLPFGAPQLWIELAGLLEHDAFADAVARYGRELAARTSGETSVFASGLVAFAAARLHDPDLARRAWQILLGENAGGLSFVEAVDPVSGATIRELLRDDRAMGHTVMAAQWSLGAIQALELIPETLPGP